MCGLETSQKAGFSFGDTEKVLIPLVVSSSPPAFSKAKPQFSNHVTQAIAKYHGTSGMDVTSLLGRWNLNKGVSEEANAEKGPAGHQRDEDQQGCGTQQQYATH